jgi:1-deoxy-D-xylulose 5-phosphate reductoisomerase
MVASRVRAPSSPSPVRHLKYINRLNEWLRFVEKKKRAFIHCDTQFFPIIFLIYVHVQTQNMQKMVFNNKIIITKIMFAKIKFSIIMDLNTEKISKRNTTNNFDRVKRKITIKNSKL